MINFSFKPRLFIYLFFGFILATIVGTQTHEMGHYVAAKHFDFEAVLHYASVSFEEAETAEELEMEKFYDQHREKMIAKESSPEQTRFFTWFYRNKHKHFLITVAGPLQTIITGTLGLALLFYRRKKIKQNGLRLFDWVAVFLTLFWSRQLGILLQKTLHHIKGSRGHGDEENIAQYLEINQWIPSLITGAISAAIILYVIFKVVPAQQRFTFIIAGATGCIAGAVLWFGFIGPAILP